MFPKLSFESVGNPTYEAYLEYAIKDHNLGFQTMPLAFKMPFYIQV